jgi:RNA exonuclease NGL2
LDRLLPILESSGYDHTYAAGPRKKHGCLIAYRGDAFERVGARVVCYDDMDIRTEGAENARKGLSHQTKNIASIVALQRKGTEGQGVIVATTHLFWHPSYDSRSVMSPLTDLYLQIYLRARKARLAVFRFCAF